MFILSYFYEFSGALHLAVSKDLLEWNALNRQEPILEAKVGGKYWRDPFIIQSPNGVFHLLCTDGWASPNIAHAWSNDLINWSKQQIIPVMKDYPSARNAWAPEACYDYQRNEFIIFWSSTVDEAFPEHHNKPKDYRNHRIYSCTTKEFKQFSDTNIFFDPGYNTIDASINYNGETYLMAFKDERGDNSYFPNELARKHILTATTKDLNSNWDIDSNPVSKTTYSNEQSNNKETWTEGPCVFWNKKEKEWWIFYEYFRSHKYGAIKSKDMKNWINMDSKIKFPEGAKHGTIFEINHESIINQLEKLILPIDEDDW